MTTQQEKTGIADKETKEGGRIVSNELIYRWIQAERERQVEKWGRQRCTPIEWSAILSEETGEVCRAALKLKHEGGTIDDIESELIQTAAVAVQILENIRDKKLLQDPQNYD